MITVRVTAPAALADDIRTVLMAEPGLSSLTVQPSESPVGTCFTANIPREHANRMVEALHALGVQEEGTIQLIPAGTWISQRAYEADIAAPGAAADAVVWADVIERAYQETALTWMYLSFMVLATLLAAIAVITDSTVLLIGAMVLGPEFVAVAALGLALVRRRRRLFVQSVRTLAIGFAVSILVTTAVVAILRAFHLVTINDVSAPHGATDFIASPNIWSLLVAFLAGVAGVLAITSARGGGLVGVFISVTTIPASGYIAVSVVFARWEPALGSLEQLIINIAGMAVAGWITLALQQRIYARIPALRVPASVRARGRRAQR